MTSDERLIAIHEAGHAIVAREHGLDFDAFLFPDEPDAIDSGAVSAAFASLEPRHNAAGTLAGQLAEAIAEGAELGDVVRRLTHEVTAALDFRHGNSSVSDVDGVARLLAAHVLDWLAEALIDALEVLHRRWADVEELADRLLAERSVTEGSPPP